MQKIPAVEYFATDMSEHTVTVEFDDEQMSIDDVIRALNQAGYTVPSHSKAL